jgi:DNA-binding NarL/FixJ family response regulator
MVYRQMRVMYDEGKNDHEIGEELGISANTVRNWRHREGLQSVTGRHNTTEEAIMERRRQMLRLWKEGKNDREIAEAVGVTKKTVQTWRHRAGIASNYERGKSHANE